MLKLQAKHLANFASNGPSAREADRPPLLAKIRLWNKIDDVASNGRFPIKSILSVKDYFV